MSACYGSQTALYSSVTFMLLIHAVHFLYVLIKQLHCNVWNDQHQPTAAELRPAVLLQHHHLHATRVPLSAMTTQAATSTIKAPADGDFYKYGLKPVIGKGSMDATLKRLGPVQIKAMERSNFVKPQSVMYELDG